MGGSGTEELKMVSFPLMFCDSWMFVKKDADRKKKKQYLKSNLRQLTNKLIRSPNKLIQKVRLFFLCNKQQLQLIFYNCFYWLKYLCWAKNTVKSKINIDVPKECNIKIKEEPTILGYSVTDCTASKSE